MRIDDVLKSHGVGVGIKRGSEVKVEPYLKFTSSGRYQSIEDSNGNVYTFSLNYIWKHDFQGNLIYSKVPNPTLNTTPIMGAILTTNNDYYVFSDNKDIIKVNTLTGQNSILSFGTSGFLYVDDDVIVVHSKTQMKCFNRETLALLWTKAITNVGYTNKISDDVFGMAGIVLDGVYPNYPFVYIINKLTGDFVKTKSLPMFSNLTNIGSVIDMSTVCYGYNNGIRYFDIDTGSLISIITIKPHILSFKFIDVIENKIIGIESLSSNSQGIYRLVMYDSEGNLIKELGVVPNLTITRLEKIYLSTISASDYSLFEVSEYIVIK